MATIIALMISLGVITSASEATPQSIEQFQLEHPEFIGDADTDIM